jgi:signal transduction histidine kinase
MVSDHDPECESNHADERPRLLRRLIRPEVRIAVVYVLLASLWIIGSDSLLGRITNGGQDSFFLQTFKGLNFVITTGILLYLVLKKAYGGWRRAERQRMDVVNSSREKLRNLTSRIQTLREEESTRIAREIHDELGQMLTGIKMRMRMIEDRLGDRDDRSLNPLIDEMVETTAMIDEVIDAVRRIASGLRPPVLDDLGLAAALEGEAEQFSRRTGIQCVLDQGRMPDKLPRDLAIAAFRIFQECLTNVARHAQAKRVDAWCGLVDGNLELRVKDDGLGLDPAAIRNPHSLGLAGMLERAADAGGRITFETLPDTGAGIVLSIPLGGTQPSPSGQTP